MINKNFNFQIIGTIFKLYIIIYKIVKFKDWLFFLMNILKILTLKV